MNNTHLTVAIVAYNAEDTLQRCLDAICSTSYQDFELLVVDDGSRDSTGRIASNYTDRILTHTTNQGRSRARNTAIREARGSIIIFVDADVVIPSQTLQVIDDYFKANPEVDALTGMLDKKHPYENYFSQYKNLYMNHCFRRLPESVTFLYGSLHAIRRKAMCVYDSEFFLADDTDLGQRLVREGKRIAFLRELTVVHWKRYNFKSWVINDFCVPFDWAKIFVRNGGISQLGRKGTGFAHASLEQILGLMLAMLIIFQGVGLLLYPGFAWPLVLCLCMWFFLKWDFFRYLAIERGVGFALKAIPVTLLDDVVMMTGVACGFLSSLLSFFIDRFISKRVNLSSPAD